MNYDRPVHVDSLLCVGGVAHGDRANIYSNEHYVAVAQPRRLKIRPVNQPIDMNLRFSHDRYRRRWFRIDTQRPFEVLVCEGVSEEQALPLLTDLIQNQGKKP